MSNAGDPQDPGWAPFGMAPPPRHLHWRRIALLAAIVLLAAAAGLGALTLRDHLDSHSAAIAGLSTGATQLSVPSVTFTAGVLPTTPVTAVSRSVAQTTAPITTPPPSTPSPVRTTAPPAPAPWIVVTDSAAHVRAEFPIPPRQKDTTITYKGVTVTRHDAIAARSTVYTQVSSMDLPVDVAPSQVNGVLEELDAGLTRDLGAKTKSDSATTFQGHPARQVVVSSLGTGSLTMLLVMWDSRRIYIVIANTGATFTHLTSSFSAL